MSLIDPHELKHAANDTLLMMANGIEKTADILKLILNENGKKAVEIYKGRHENPIFRKINGKTIIDKITPLDRSYLNDKLKEPASISKEIPNTNFDNYRIDIDRETIYQESSDGRVNINRNAKFYTPTPERESEFTVADAFSPEYDPPEYSPPEDYLDRVSPFDNPLNNQVEPAQAAQKYSESANGVNFSDNTSQDNQVNEQKYSPEKNIDAEAVFIVVDRDLEQVKSSRTKSLLQSAASRLKDRIRQLDKIVSRQLEISQQKSTAKTLKKLFDANLMQTGETTYKSNTLDVKLKGLNTYQVTDKQGNIKLEFNQERFGNIKISQSSLSGNDFKSIEKATKSVNSLGADTIFKQNMPQRINLLGSMASESDHQIRQDLDTNGVAKTAKSFLHYMGVDSWNREGGQYELQKSGNNLRIKAKDSGQEILRIYDGKLSSRLKPKDINFFRKLDSSMNMEVNKIRAKNLNTSLGYKSTPKRFNQQELSR